MTQRDGQSAPSKPAAWRAASLLTVAGATAAEFLQGYLTCDTQRINPQTATPMAICNVQGRVLASGWAIAMENAIGLIVHASVAAEVEQFLKPYVTFSKCSLNPDGMRLVFIKEFGRHEARGADTHSSCCLVVVEEVEGSCRGLVKQMESALWVSGTFA